MSSVQDTKYILLESDEKLVYPKNGEVLWHGVRYSICTRENTKDGGEKGRAMPTAAAAGGAAASAASEKRLELGFPEKSASN